MEQGEKGAGVFSEADYPMLMFLLETPATLVLPGPFLDPDSLPTHEASPSSLPPPLSLLGLGSWVQK